MEAVVWPMSEAAANWQDLVERIQRGDESGMEELYRIFGRGIRYYLCRQLGVPSQNQLLKNESRGRPSLLEGVSPEIEGWLTTLQKRLRGIPLLAVTNNTHRRLSIACARPWVDR